MPSPFPGMNPYLEQADVWTDFHDRLVPVIAESLGEQVTPNYIVKLQGQLYVHEIAEEKPRIRGRADVSLVPGEAQGAMQTNTATLEKPTAVQLVDVDMERIASVEIRGRVNLELVTVIELLSPANKYSHADREQYLSKRHRLLGSAVHLIEIDLLRGGPRLPLHGAPPCDYCILVSRAEQRPNAELWPFRLREPVPAVPVPLRLPDSDARLDLQPLLHRVYDAAHYEDWIYKGSPSPNLSAEDAAWAEEILKGIGR
jgi:hypothetical protein